jgi:hypothetical protein
MSSDVLPQGTIASIFGIGSRGAYGLSHAEFEQYRGVLWEPVRFQARQHKCRCACKVSGRPNRAQRRLCADSSCSHHQGDARGAAHHRQQKARHDQIARCSFAEEPSAEPTPDAGAAHTNLLIGALSAGRTIRKSTNGAAETTIGGRRRGVETVGLPMKPRKLIWMRFGHERRACLAPLSLAS